MPKKIPAKKTIKKIDWSGTGRGPMRVPTRVTGGPVLRGTTPIKKATPKRKAK